MKFDTTVESGENMSVVGPTHLSSVDCESFSAAGATKGDGDIDAETVSLKGTASVGGDVKATGLVAQGSTNIAGDVTADETVVKGSTRVDGDLQTDRLEAKGSVRFEDVCADAVTASGALSVADLVASEVKTRGVVDANYIRADEIRVGLSDEDSTVGAIVGGRVSVERETESSEGRLDAETVEGDVVSLEHATVEEVTGETVSLGPGARVGTVRAEELEVDERATVESTESLS